MVETQRSVAAWANTTFGVAGDRRSAARANEEMAELLTAIASDDRPRAIEEMADVVICLYRLADNLGVDLSAEVDRKMARNRKRKWKVDGSGCGYHR